MEPVEPHVPAGQPKYGADLKKRLPSCASCEAGCELTMIELAVEVWKAI